jgi:hypothetical protein
MPTGDGVSNGGVRPVESSSGITASEIRIETRMNSSPPAGSARLSRNCPPAAPPSTTTM